MSGRDIDKLFASDSSDDEEEQSAPAKKAEDKTSAYDEETTEVATEADKSFIDAEDGNEGIMEEYNKQQQTFSEDERDDEFENSKPVSTRPNSGREKDVALTRQDALGMLASIVRDMDDAADKDDIALKSDEPAFEKLQASPKILERLQNAELKEYLLDPDVKLLDAYARWLRPSTTGLCALGVRTPAYEFINELDIEMERDLKNNDLGKVLMALRKNEHETAHNRRLITSMIQKWTLRLQEKYNQRRQETVRYRKRKAAQTSTAARKQSDEDDDDLESRVLKGRAEPTRTNYYEMKLVEMGTDRIQRKQARLSKRIVEPEKRTANKVMAQLRRAKSAKGKSKGKK